MAELYSLPDGWNEKKLNTLCKLEYGKNLPTTIMLDYGYKVFGPNGVIGYYSEFNCENIEVLISCRGANSGVVNLSPKESFVTNNSIRCKDLDVSSTDKMFLYYFLKTYDKSKIVTGSAQPQVTIQPLDLVSIPLPPLEEQKRIVAKMDNLFAKIDIAIALHQKNIDEVNVFMASVLNDVFVELEEKYEKLFLNDVSTFQNGFAFKSNEFNTTGNGLQVIRIGNVLDINKNQVFIEKRKEFEKYLLKENDIVISMTGTRGKKDYLFVRVITSNDSYLNQRVGKISNKNNSNYMYLYYFLQSNYFRDKIFEFETGTVNQGNISSKDILNTKIPLPNMQVQQKVVSYLDEISQKMEKIKQIQKDKMQSLKELKASILDKAFKGEL